MPKKTKKKEEVKEEIPSQDEDLLVEAIRGDEEVKEEEPLADDDDEDWATEEDM